MKEKTPHLSLVMPCYNEEAAIQTTAPALIGTFTREHIRLQLILVDNGSTDGTGKCIDALISSGYPVTKVGFEKNQGYGGGILAGLRRCEAPIVGYLCADGQVSAEDTLMAYRLIKGREDRTITKVRRRFRKDSWKRKIVSIIYNGMMQVLYGGLGAIDINGSPKIFSRRNLETMDLVSTDWFLDPELMVKAKYMGLRIIEVDVEGHARKGGASHVRVSTIAEFLKNIARYRFGDALRSWKQRTGRPIAAPVQDHTGALHQATSGTAAPAATDPLQPVLSRWGVRIVEQKRHEDSRGFLQKVLTASQCQGVPPRGEVYVTSAKPGEAKGNHYHLNMGEWFTVIQGEGQIDVFEPKSGEKASIPLGVARPQTVYIPAGLGHAVVNRDSRELICVAWAEGEHDPGDVYPLHVFP